MSDTPYAPDAFAAPSRDCDLIMKGGVTSGLVYPYAILELARVYRFRSIGGASAGGIAAAFAAAAEYSRSVRGDPEGFIRLKRHCDELPERLSSLFQPTPALKPLFDLLMAVQARPGVLSVLKAIAVNFWMTVLIGLLAGTAVAVVLDGEILALVLAAVAGVVIALVVRLGELLARLRRQDYGLCPGVTQAGSDNPGLTDWLHEALQDIAFGEAGREQPLTFGDLEPSDGDGIELRMVTTNLSLRRPHTLPRLGVSAGIRLKEWEPLFPAPVMAYLERTLSPFRRVSQARAFPKPDQLPVIVAVRMSLSFPFLFQAVPLVMRDVHGAMLSRRVGGDGGVRVRRVLLSDGGLSSNFPIHMFDALLPARPTFALSLDDLPLEDADPSPERRVLIPNSARDGLGTPIAAIDGVGGFASSLLGAAKDWNDNLLAGMPGQRERIARVLLTRRQGGLNLAMPPDESRVLMAYGREVGARFAAGALDFDEHRWRRFLVAYEQLEATVHQLDQIWNEAGFADWYRDYAPKVGSYRRLTKADRTAMHRRLDAFTRLAEAFAPRVARADDKFPRPQGRLRIGPLY